MLRRITAMAWRTGRRAVVPLLACRLVTGVSAAVLPTATARATSPILGAGTVADRPHRALPALGFGSVGSSTKRTAARRRDIPR